MSRPAPRFGLTEEGKRKEAERLRAVLDGTSKAAARVQQDTLARHNQIPMKMPTYQQAAMSVPPVAPPQYVARPAAVPFSPAPPQYAPQPTSFTPAPVYQTYV
jgi:hypothetical protein